MKYEYVVERARDEKQMLENSCLADTGDPEDKPEKKPEIIPRPRRMGKESLGMGG